MSMQNNANTVLPVAGSEAERPEITGVEAAIRKLEEMRQTAIAVRAKRSQAKALGYNSQQLDAIVVDVTRAWARFYAWKEFLHYVFPDEPHFMTKSVRTVGADSSASILNSLPRLVRSDEQVDGNHGPIHHNIKPFVANLEDIAKPLKLDLDTCFPIYMNLILGATFKEYIQHRVSGVNNADNLKWEDYKGWLFDFTNTPRQKLKDLDAIFSVQIRDNECMADFGHRYKKLLNNLTLENLTINERTNGHVIKRLPYDLQQQVVKFILGSKENILDYGEVEFCNFLINENFGTNRSNNNKHDRVINDYLNNQSQNKRKAKNMNQSKKRSHKSK